MEIFSQPTLKGFFSLAANIRQPGYCENSHNTYKYRVVSRRTLYFPQNRFAQLLIWDDNDWVKSVICIRLLNAEHFPDAHVPWWSIDPQENCVKPHAAHLLVYRCLKVSWKHSTLRPRYQPWQHIATDKAVKHTPVYSHPLPYHSFCSNSIPFTAKQINAPGPHRCACQHCLQM